VTPGPRERIAGALEALSERRRLLLALNRIDGLAPAELACVLGGTEAAVARELALAQRQLERRARLASPLTSSRTGPRTALTRAPRACEEKTRWQA
jgi:hypothetical protein